MPDHAAMWPVPNPYLSVLVNEHNLNSKIAMQEENTSNIIQQYKIIVLVDSVAFS